MDHDFDLTTVSSSEQSDQANIPSLSYEESGKGQNFQHNDGEKVTVSVVIDEDEEEASEEVGNQSTDELAAVILSNESDQSHLPHSDHDYENQQQYKQQTATEQQNLSFPTIDGLEIAEGSEEYSSAPVLAKAYYHPPRQTAKRLGGYSGECPPNYGYGSSGYYRQQQMKGGPDTGAPHKYVPVAPHNQFQSSPTFSQQRQRQTLRNDRFPADLRPTYRGRPPTIGSRLTNMDWPVQNTTAVARAAGAGGNPYRNGNYSIPPSQQHRSGYFGENVTEQFPNIEGAMAAPIVAVRGRPAGSRNKSSMVHWEPETQNMKSANKSYDDRDRDLIGLHDYIPPLPSESHHTYAQRRPFTASPQKRIPQSRKEQLLQQREHEQLEQQNTFIDEEERLNQDFFSEQRMKFNSTGQGRVRRSKKSHRMEHQIDRATGDLIAAQQDSGKPPDDPFLPPQEMPPQSTSASLFESSTLDGTINSVIRGDASVMQQHFGTPMPHHHFQQPNQQFVMPTDSGAYYGHGHIVHQTRPLFENSPQQLNHQGLEDLADIAQLQQAASSSMGGPSTFYQQKQQFQTQQQQLQPTLHFKVVQTSEPFQQQQDYRQPVFTIQQQPDQFNTAAAVQSDLIQKPEQEKAEKIRRPRRNSKKYTDEIGEEKDGQSFSTPSQGIPSKTEGEGEEEIVKRRQSARRKREDTIEEAKNNLEKETSKFGEAQAKDTSAIGKPEREPRKKKTDGKDYVTRCVCRMTHNDPFMIACDRCDVWQHGVCMGISEGSVPDKYFCEQCNPRPLKLTPKQAQAIQKRQLNSLYKKTKKNKVGRKKKLIPLVGRNKQKKILGIANKILKKRRMMAKVGRPMAGRMAKTSAAKSQIKKNRENIEIEAKHQHKEFVSTKINHYSRGIRALISLKQSYILGDIKLLNRLKNNEFARQMLVAPNVNGLVATPGPNTNLPPGVPIIEYNGSFSLLSEAKNRTPRKASKHEFTLIYSGLGEENLVFVDATKSGSVARYARRSCRPNTSIQHAIVDGRVHIYFYAAANIDNSTEITIPFDYDYRESKVPVDCACGLDNLALNSANEGCPVQKFNKFLLQPSDLNIPPILKTDESLSRPARRTEVLAILNNPPAKPQANTSKNSTSIPNSEPQSSSKPVKEKKEMPTNISFNEHNLRTRRSSNIIEKPTKESPREEESGGRGIRAAAAAAAKAIKESEKSKENEEIEIAVKAEESGKAAKSQISKQNFAHSQLSPPAVSAKNSIVEKSPTTSRSSPTKSVISGGLSSLINAYRRTASNPLPGNQKSPTVVKVSSKNLTKEERGSKQLSILLLSREERKMQATIEAYERAEQSKGEKKKRPIGQNDFESPTKKVRIEEDQPSVSTNSKTNKSPMKISTSKVLSADLWFQLCQVLRKRKSITNFSLPKDFESLRAKIDEEMKKSQEGKVVQKKEEISPKKQKIANGKFEAVLTTNRETTVKMKMPQPREHHLNEVSSGETEQEQTPTSSTKAASEDANKTPENDSTTVQPTPSETESSTTGEIRPPNTKARKKISIEEYKRKKMAEMGANLGEQANNITGIAKSSQSPASTVSPIIQLRQSPRKSFIPSITFGTIPSPPHQFDDFAPSPPPIGGGNRPASLDELKKRILGNARNSETDELPSSHPPLPLESTLPQQKSKQESLDDRLRARFGPK